MTNISKTDDLVILLAVFDLGGFSAAANSLDHPVAKVTRAIQRLEQRLDTNLFNRTTRKVEPTEECIDFVQQVRKGLEYLEHAEETLQLRKQAPSGWLRVDAASPFILHQIVPLVTEFQQRYPLITLELVSNESVIDLIEKRTDVAIRIGQLDDSNLHAIKLGRSPLRLVASPNYLKVHGTPQSIQDLHHHRLIGFTRGSTLNHWPLSDSFEIRPSIAASSGETLLQLCLANQGIALISNFMVAAALKNGALVEVLPGVINRHSPRQEVHAVFYRNTTLSKRISVFIDFLATRLSL
ncbi:MULTISPECIES: LysR family transcriptional regulator [unclassified Oceanobacter]|jgi:DNA-binding transcriptional LysR family regulator|uniref:LysR family transcriptional regulator n=1 Tax=unclassified Oceanobacter TaxID=2620260 RepID=UPI0026E34142|nr:MULTISPECIES: LysR family transcriptional regulator [unclassified Oceanobacter]MDO6682190.1 LysR family transcriptional regulator [Oceanobacter sp. 5_MG-2023]MDP2504923.1 LysR family transcriptional regulator [Oceanobacter sp. 3_MG-2023]MDP2546367.1 LysR family transcriptional regulator [Oceanobacter sp. 4_MG-2023]MDP2610443.1 LysR family transcriptional regulator [Oceanobacter sp. 1_MG-2023]MDP2613679.1 LysR family transcriptional regulator [Oceanobacter sp. 2_MG-2023]